MVATPELANWLTSLYPDKQLIIASYIYQDGEAFVRASVAMDAIVQAVEERRSVTTALAYIDTPTHVHVVPNNCAEISSSYYAERAGAENAFLRCHVILQPMILPKQVRDKHRKS